jgi:hypothetical protein
MVVPVGRRSDRSRPLSGDGWVDGGRCGVACRGVVVDERDKDTVGDCRFDKGCRTGPRQPLNLGVHFLVTFNSITLMLAGQYPFILLEPCVFKSR